MKVQGAKTYVVEKDSRLKFCWNEDADIATTRSLINSISSPTHLSRRKIKMVMGYLILEKIFLQYPLEAGAIDYSKGNDQLDGPDQDRGALEEAIWAIVPCVQFCS